jgi:ubiquitin carboxyl-terminal hydrolase 8
LSLGQTKLREATKLPTPPVSPGRFSAGTQYNHVPTPSAITPSNSTHSSHTFVSPSTLGPPSPSSTPSSSPPTASLLNDVDLTGFAQAFPTIDELDEHPPFSLPSVPTGIGASINKPYTTDLRHGDAAATQFPFRTFTVPIERPSSTPITPTNNNFSRPPSPNKATLLSKPSGLSSGVTAGSSTPKVPIRNKNTAFPNDLLSYIRDHNVLLIDIRNRVDFEREHIKANAVICIEPSILMREG